MSGDGQKMLTSQPVAPVTQNVAQNATPAKRRGKQWLPGQSGNPGGRTATNMRKLAMLEHLSFPAIKRLGQLSQSENEQVALAACNSILDRTMGKPKQSAEVTVNTVDWTALHLAALRRMSEATTLDVTPNEPNEA